MLNRDGSRKRRDSRVSLLGWVILLASTVTVLATLPPVVVDRALSALPAVLGLGPTTSADAREGLPHPSIEGIVVPPPPPSPLQSFLAPRVLSPVAIEWAPHEVAPPGPVLNERLVAHRPAARWPVRDALSTIGPLIPLSNGSDPLADDPSRWRVLTRPVSAVGKGVAKGSTSVAKGVAKGSTSVAKGVAKGSTSVAKGVAKGSTSVAKGVAKVSTSVAKGVAKASVSTARVFKKMGLFLTRPFRGQSEDERQMKRWSSS
jgi:hypothetical protein